MQCPHCQHEVSVFSTPWQAQRERPVKHCPSCTGEVEVVFRLSVFCAWLSALTFTSALLALAMGRSGPMGGIVGFTVGLPAGLFASIALRKPKPLRGLRAVLYRPLALPQRFQASSGVKVTGKATWVAVTAIFAIGAVALWLPAPWEGFALLALGALGFWRAEAWFTWFKLQGKPAQLYWGTIAAVGIFLLTRQFMP